MSGILNSKIPTYRVLTKQEVISAPFDLVKGEVFYRRDNIFSKLPFDTINSDIVVLIAKYNQTEGKDIHVYVIDMVRNI